MNYPGTWLSTLPRELRREVYNRWCEATWIWDETSPEGALVIDDGIKEYVIPVVVAEKRDSANHFLHYAERGYVSTWKPNPKTRMTYKPRSQTLVIDDGTKRDEIPYCPKVVNALRQIPDIDAE